MSSVAEPPRNDSVFINCAFDPDFLEMSRAIIFAVKACGYEPKTAQDVMDSGESRIWRIRDMIAQCDYGIHDISAVTLDAATAMPRFNMPLELGMSLGAKWYGGKKQRGKRVLVLDSKPHQYDASISDISGQDISHHGSDPARAIACVRDWLLHQRAPSTRRLPGGKALASDWKMVRRLIDAMIVDDRLDPWDELSPLDFLRCVDEGLRVLEEIRKGGEPA